jgi:hypothetical protein
MLQSPFPLFPFLFTLTRPLLGTSTWLLLHHLMALKVNCKTQKQVEYGDKGTRSFIGFLQTDTDQLEYTKTEETKERNQIVEK